MLPAERSRGPEPLLSIQENDTGGRGKGHRCDDSAAEIAHRRWQLDAASFHAGFLDERDPACEVAPEHAAPRPARSERFAEIDVKTGSPRSFRPSPGTVVGHPLSDL